MALDGRFPAVLPTLHSGLDVEKMKIGNPESCNHLEINIKIFGSENIQK